MAKKSSAIDSVVEKAASDIKAIEETETGAVNKTLPSRMKQMLADMRAKSDVASSADLAALEAEIDKN